MYEFLVRSYRYSSLVSQAWYVFVLFKPFSRFTALADLHSRAWDDIQSSARQNKVVCLSESPESGRWKEGIAKVLPQQIYSGILTMDYQGMNLVHEIFLCSREQKASCVIIIYHLVLKRLPTIELIWRPSMKAAIWTTKAWVKKHVIGESDNNTKNIGRHGRVSRRMIVGALRSYRSKMDKLARLTTVTNFLGTENSTAYLTFNGILSNACQGLQKRFVTSFIYLFIYLLREGIGG